MNFRILIALLFTVSLAKSQDTPKPVIVSMGDLASKGILIERVRYQTPMASVSIQALVERVGGPENYESTECVVLGKEISLKDLSQIDSLPIGSPQFARRSVSLKLNPIFIIRGREVPDAYLAFDFSSETAGQKKIERRYLLPLSRVTRKEHHPSESAPTLN